MRGKASLDSTEKNELFDRIFKDYHRQMEYTAFAVLQNRHDAEDAVQDAFIALSAHAELLSEMESFRLYYYVTETARHKAIDLLRKRKDAVRYNDEIDSETDEKDFTEDIALKDSADEMLIYIKELPERYRDVLSLCYVNGLSVSEIADTVGRSAATVRKQLERGRAILLKRWKERHDD
jgi:RNA polymerase sigma-70 factor, ECF subfamily